MTTITWDQVGNGHWLGEDGEGLMATVEPYSAGLFMLTLQSGTLEITLECDTPEQGKVFAECWPEAIAHWNAMVIARVGPRR